LLIPEAGNDPAAESDSARVFLDFCLAFLKSHSARQIRRTAFWKLEHIAGGIGCCADREVHATAGQEAGDIDSRHIGTI
jgi:hypothetical protein